jgi:hypothetical protein
LGDPSDRARLGLVRERELRDRVGEQEQRQEHDRRRGEHLQERADRLRRRVERRQRGADRDREDDQERVRQVDRLLQRLGGDQGDERRDQDEVRALTGGPPGEPYEQLHPQEHERRQHNQEDGEADDVEARRATGGEELGVVLQEVEQGLGDRERPEDGEAEVGPEGFAKRDPRLGSLGRRGGFGRAHPRFGRA